MVQVSADEGLCYFKAGLRRAPQMPEIQTIRVQQTVPLEAGDVPRPEAAKIQKIPVQTSLLMGYFMLCRAECGRQIGCEMCYAQTMLPILECVSSAIMSDDHLQSQ